MAVFHGQSKAESAALGNGHALLDFRPDLGDYFERMIRRTDEGEDYYRTLVDRLGPDRAAEVVRTNGGLGFNVLIYPNLLIIQTQLRVMHPREVSRTEVDLHPTTLVHAPDAVNRARLRGHEGFYGPAGGGAPDDLEMFRRVGDGLAVESMEWLWLHRGLGRTRTSDDGREIGHITDEHPQRGFYRQWRLDMGPMSRADELTGRVERFLYTEAALLDRGELAAWLDLFADDCTYWVPAGPAEVNPAEDVSIIYDNRVRLARRIEWLTSGRAYAQQPASATVRQVSNVLVVAEPTGDGLVEVSCVAVIWERRPNTAPQQVATRVTYRLREQGDGFAIVAKTVILLDHSRHWENLTFVP